MGSGAFLSWLTWFMTWITRVDGGYNYTSGLMDFIKQLIFQFVRLHKPENFDSGSTGENEMWFTCCSTPWPRWGGMNREQCVKQIKTEKHADTECHQEARLQRTALAKSQEPSPEKQPHGVAIRVSRVSFRTHDKAKYI